MGLAPMIYLLTKQVPSLLGHGGIRAGDGSRTHAVRVEAEGAAVTLLLHVERVMGNDPTGLGVAHRARASRHPQYS